jgi:hypothetical protein
MNKVRQITEININHTQKITDDTEKVPEKSERCQRKNDATRDVGEVFEKRFR